MATRYFQTAVDGREDMDFLYQLPTEQIQALTQFNDSMITQTTTGLQDALEEQLKQYNAYDSRRDQLEDYKNLHRSNVEEVAKAIASDQRADAWKSQIPNLRTLGNQLKNDLAPTGRIGRLDKDYKDIMAATTAANKNIKNASYRHKYLENLKNTYEKTDKVKPRQIFEEIDIQKRIMDRLKNMKANRELAEDVDLGDIAKTLTTKGYSGISPDRVMKAALSGLSADYELMAYLKEMSDLDVAGFNNVLGKDDEGNPKFNFTEEVEVKDKDGKTVKMITPASNVVGQAIQSVMDTLSYSETINKQDKSYSPIYVANHQQKLDIEKDVAIQKNRDKGSLDPVSKIIMQSEITAASDILKSELEMAGSDKDKIQAARDRYDKSLESVALKYNPNVTITEGGVNQSGVAQPGSVLFNPLEGKNGYNDLIDVATKSANDIKNLKQAKLELENEINAKVAKGEPVSAQTKARLNNIERQLTVARNEYMPNKLAIDKIEGEILKEFDAKFKDKPGYYEMRSYIVKGEGTSVDKYNNTWIERFVEKYAITQTGDRNAVGEKLEKVDNLDQMAEWFSKTRQEKFDKAKQSAQVQLPTTNLSPTQVKTVWEDINTSIDEYIAFAQNPKNVTKRNSDLLSPSISTIKNILADNNMKMEDAFDKMEMTSGISGKSGSYILKVKDGVNISNFYEPGSKIIIQPTHDVAVQRVVSKMAGNNNILVGQEPVFNAILNKGINDFEMNMATAPKYAGSDGKIPEIKHTVEVYDPSTKKSQLVPYIIEPMSNGANGVESYRLYKEVVDNGGVKRVPLDATRNISDNNSFSSIEALRVAIFGL